MASECSGARAGGRAGLAGRWKAPNRMDSADDEEKAKRRTHQVRCASFIRADRAGSQKRACNLAYADTSYRSHPLRPKPPVGGVHHSSRSSAHSAIDQLATVKSNQLLTIAPETRMTDSPLWIQWKGWPVGAWRSGSAPALGAGGRRFESCRPDHLYVQTSRASCSTRYSVAGSLPAALNSSTLDAIAANPSCRYCPCLHHRPCLAEQ